jgi:hypothetical protein
VGFCGRHSEKGTRTDAFKMGGNRLSMPEAPGSIPNTARKKD